VLALAVIAIAFFALPLFGLLWRAPWSQAWHYLTERDSVTALRLSLQCSAWATLLSIVFGVPLAWLLARVEFPGRSLVRALCTLSMVLPPVVGGVALLFALGRRGLVGQWLDRWFDYQIPFTTTAVVVAQTFVAMPFLVITVEAALRQANLRTDEAAHTLGASPWYTFRRITLPEIRPALIAGTVLCWARALGEFGATITFAGNFPGTTQTMPMRCTWPRVEPEAVARARTGDDRDSFSVLAALATAGSASAGCRNECDAGDPTQGRQLAPGGEPGGRRR
jgi:molybdate transport system permease protein